MKRKFLKHFCVLLLVAGICLIQFKVSASATVASETFQDGKESLHGVLQKTQLEPPLRDDIRHIRFSPDGKYVLAQDEAGINVLTKQPFAAIFRINARRVSGAQFTPDSQNIIFHNSDLRVEVWSVSGKNLKSAHDVTFSGYCNQSRLSPDGKTLACLDFGRDLVLIDVTTSAEILRQDDFHTAPYEGMLVLFPGWLGRDDSLNRRVNMDFSPDGRYFAAGIRHLRQRSMLDKSSTVTSATRRENPREYEDNVNDISEGRPSIDVYRPGENAESSKAVAFDLTKRKQVSLGAPLKDLLAGGFTFISPNRVAGVHRQDRSKSALVTFPEGQTINVLPLEQGQLDEPGRGNYLLIRPFKNYPVAVMNLTDGTVLMANKKAAIDIYEDIYVAERADGEVGLYGVGKNDLRAKIQLPRSPLAYVGAVALSPDFSLLAISGRTRAAVWDLKKGERLFLLRNFSGAHYAEDGAFYVDFPTLGSVARTIAILQPQQRQVLTAHELGDSKTVPARQHGQFLIIMQNAQSETQRALTSIQVPISTVRASSSTMNATLEVKDVRAMTPLWSKPFPKEAPTVWVDAPNEMMVLSWDVKDEAAKVEIKSDAKLSKQLSLMKDKEGDYFLQILDARTGQKRGSLLMDTEKGSFFVWKFFAVNDSVVAVDSNKQIRVYSLASGQQTGKVPGIAATASRQSGLLCVEGQDGKLTIYDLANMQERDRFVFSSQVSFARFNNDGKRLFVLTEDQTAYVLDVSSFATTPK